ncbi:MAG: C4-type zinc ribbon domain-containing protein [Candidatus Zixiibacteriota bacterium]
MNGDLELLLKLQNIDYDLGELERSKEYIPDMMENLRKEVEDSKSRFDTLQSELSSAKVEQKDIDLTVQQKQERLKELQGHMMAIKTNKEYDALVAEIDKLKDDISQLDSRGLELLEKIESHEKEINGLQEQLESIEKVNGEQLNSLQEQIDSVGAKISNKQKEREELADQVGKRARSVYERIRKGKGGAAVVAVKKRACGACYKALPPQKIQEIRKGEQLITCDSCGRMLIWTEDSNN